MTLAIRVRPGSSRTAVGGRYDGPFGPALVVAVQAPAIEGRATEAAVRAVAEALRIKPRMVRVMAGEMSRDKLLAITDAPSDLATRIDTLRG
jgi:uncharacterized protein YggU (UPF0235/DUF167 family)